MRLPAIEASMSGTVRAFIAARMKAANTILCQELVHVNH